MAKKSHALLIGGLVVAVIGGVYLYKRSKDKNQQHAAANMAMAMATSRGMGRGMVVGSAPRKGTLGMRRPF